MRKFTVGNRDLLKAVEKASVGIKETYIISVTMRPDKEGNKYASVQASDGEVQGMASFTVKSNETEPFKVIVGKEFHSIIKTLSQWDKDIEMVVEENSAVLKSGTSIVPIALREDGMSIAPCNPKNEPGVISILVDSKELIPAVKKGGFAYQSGNSGAAGTQDAVCIMPVTDGETNYLRFISADSNMAAGADAKLDNVDANFTAAAKAEQKFAVSLNAIALQEITAKFEAEKTQIFIFPKQVLLKNGNDFYIIRPFEKKFPLVVTGILYSDSREYKLRVNSRELKTVLDIVMLEGNAKDPIGAKLTLSKEGNMTVSSLSGKNKTDMKAASSEGEVAIAFKAQFLKVAIDKTFSEFVTLSGCGSTAPMYITGDDPKAISVIMPVRIPSAELDESKAEDSIEDADDSEAKMEE